MPAVIGLEPNLLPQVWGHQLVGGSCVLLLQDCTVMTRQERSGVALRSRTGEAKGTAQKRAWRQECACLWEEWQVGHCPEGQGSVDREGLDGSLLAMLKDS